MIEGTKYFINLLIGAIILFFVIAPYIHIFLDKKDTIKVFGFKNLRSFLFVIGMPLSLFLCSSLLLVASKYIQEKFIQKFFKIVSFLFLWSSFFQFIWIFWDRKDLPKGTYYISIILLSIIVAIVYNQFIFRRNSLVIKLRNAVNSLSRFSFIEAKKHIKPEKENDYNNDLLTTLKKGIE